MTTDLARRLAELKTAEPEAPKMTDLAERLARVKARTTPDPPSPWADDLIPDVGSARESDPEVDSLIDGLDIIEAYRRYIGKMEPKVGGKRENIMISCPIPGHTDKNPSAWANLDKGTWYCGACDRGGDIYDLAAIKFGYNLDSYKRDGSFPQLRKDMAADLGYVVRRSIGGQDIIEKVDLEPELGSSSDAEASVPTPEDTAPPAKTSYSGYSDAATNVSPEEIAKEAGLLIDWESLLPQTTFLREWMEATCGDDLPDEYYFWLGLLAVGFAAGNDVLLEDYPTVKSNLFVCLLGPTGIGKTRSISTLIRLLHEALPYDPDSPKSTGTNIIPTPGSAEALIDAFSKPEYDPADPKKIVGYNGVRGLLRFDEFSALAGRAARSGSVMKPTLMEFFDSYHAIDLKSRGAGYVRAEDHFCSTVTTTQPKAVRDIMERSDADSGFINRWVFVLGRNKKLESRRKGRFEIDHLVAPLAALRAWARMPGTPRVIGFLPEAEAIWEEFFRQEIEPIRKSSNSPLLTRLDLILKKIALIMAINEKQEVITPSIMRRTISLYPYMVNTYNIVSNEMQAVPFEDDRAIVRHVVEKYEEKNDGRGATMREIRRHIGSQVPGDILVRVVRVMVEIGELNETIIKPEGRGRPATRYTYVK